MPLLQKNPSDFFNRTVGLSCVLLGIGSAGRRSPQSFSRFIAECQISKQ